MSKNDHDPSELLLEVDRPVNPQTFAAFLVFCGRPSLISLIDSDPQQFTDATGIDLRGDPSTSDALAAIAFLRNNDGGVDGNDMTGVREFFGRFTRNLAYPDGGCPKSSQIKALSSSPGS